MAYTKHNWVNDEVITANNLNHIENAIDSSKILMLETSTEQDSSYNTIHTLNKTWNEINSNTSDFFCVKGEVSMGRAISPSNPFYVAYYSKKDISWYEENGEYYIEIMNTLYSTSDPDDYPVHIFNPIA